MIRGPRHSHRDRAFAQRSVVRTAQGLAVNRNHRSLVNSLTTMIQFVKQVWN